MKEFNHITAFIFDVDGVMTDGKIHVLANGEQIRSFCVKDGWAIVKAIQEGYHVAIISSGNYEGVRTRLEYLGVKEIHLGVKNKIEFLEQLREKFNLDYKDILYMGDDMPDLPILKKVGLPCCPSDAANDVIPVCKYISALKGGEGCVREVIEKTLRVQDKWIISDV